MPTANEILNFNFSPAALQNAARTSIPVSITRLLELRINKLKQITEVVGESSFKFTSEVMIPQVFRKFTTIVSSNEYNITSINSFDKRELKTLTYCLDYSEANLSPILSSPSQLTIAFNTLERNWRDNYLFGLIRCYLKSWETTHTGAFERLGIFIMERLKNYQGGRNTLKSLKENVRYFDSNNGNIILGSEFALTNKPIKEAAKYLSLPESWFSYPYFSKVIDAYYEKKKNNIQQVIDDLYNALQEHKNSISNRRIISKLIIQANTNDFAVLQDKIKSIAVKLIGDPEKASWTVFENATYNEKEDLKQARKILNEWITRQFINVFFEKCINDSRRKRFWLKYSSVISTFKVFGTNHTKQILKRDERISEYVDDRFKTVNSNRDISAFILYISDYMLIEFSNEGYAFYAYKLSNNFQPNLSKKLNSVDDLRNSSMPMLAYREGRYLHTFSEDGRLTHNDGDLRWEQVFEYWLKNNAGINV